MAQGQREGQEASQLTLPAHHLFQKHSLETAAPLRAAAVSAYSASLNLSIQHECLQSLIVLTILAMPSLATANIWRFNGDLNTWFEDDKEILRWQIHE